MPKAKSAERRKPSRRDLASFMPKFTPDEEENLLKLRVIIPNDNSPEGTRSLYRSALNEMPIAKLLAGAHAYAEGNAEKSLPEFLFSKEIREHFWVCAAIRSDMNPHI
jgi:hypothetical protein